MPGTIIPKPIIASIAEIISNRYSHTQLDNMFMQEDAPGEPPDGSKLVKCQEWLSRCNKDDSVDALKVLGGLIADFMEREIPEPPSWGSLSSWDQEWLNQREYIHKSLSNHGLAYFKGGYLRKVGSAGPTCSLEKILGNKDLDAVEQEFGRALETLESDPPASLTAACAIIESLCKTYIEDKNLEMPKEQSLKPLWNIVRRDLGFDPSRVEDDDLKKILSGLGSIVDGLGALRTHAGSAHGRGRTRYNIHPRHARLAVHAAHTLAAFIIETWDCKSAT